MDSARRNPSSTWSARPWTARAIRAIAFAGPMLVSVGLAWLVSSVAPRPESFLVAIVRWLAIAGFSTVVLVGLDKLARRLLPLATLFNLTLAFPDQAPSRYQLALRRGSTTQLRVRIAEARAGKLGDTPTEAAEHVLELVMALSVHDRLTRGHSERVRAYTEMIGDEMGLTPVELDRLRWAGLLHDVGKLMVSADILNKPGRLTSEEFEVIKLHPEFGRKLVAPLQGWMGEAARAVWEHHERWDGRGYPRGLSGTDISIAGRIVAVADAYDVMTSVRSYQKPISAADARAELARCSGTQFDPAVVRTFLSLSLGRLRFATGPLAWLAQLPLFPSALAAGATQGAATAATAVVGAAAASMGVGLSGGTMLPDSPPAEASAAPATVSLRDPIEVDTGARTITVSLPENAADAASAPAAGGSPNTTVGATGGGAAPRDVGTTTTIDTDATPTAGRATTTTVAIETTTTIAVPEQPGDTTTVAPEAATTTAAPTTVAIETTTTTLPPVEPPATEERPGWLPAPGVATAFHFDVPTNAAAPAVLDLKTRPPTRRDALSFDPDEDGWAGLTLPRGGAGVGWGWGGPQAAHLAGPTTATVYIATREVVPATVVVHGHLAVCDSAGACTPVADVVTEFGVGQPAVPVTLDFGTIDAVIPARGTVQITLDVPETSPTDAILFADTRDAPSALTLTFH